MVYFFLCMTSLPLLASLLLSNLPRADARYNHQNQLLNCPWFIQSLTFLPNLHTQMQQQSNFNEPMENSKQYFYFYIVDSHS